jgi:NAD(P)-dependent dehydrogenase (short-subunit alcohol dehydrogenase family)
MSEVVVVLGAGSIGQAIARRVSAGKHVVVSDLRMENAESAAEVMRNAGFEVSTQVTDVSSRDSVHELVGAAVALGGVTGIIHAAGVSPSQALPSAIVSVDLYGTALVLEEFGNVIAPGGSGVVIALQSGHRLGTLTPEQDAALATTPVDELLSLPMLQADRVADSLHAYQLAKRGNSLRVMAEAVRWAERGARINTISPGIIMPRWRTTNSPGPAVRATAVCSNRALLDVPARPTRWRPSANSSWAQPGPSSPAATSLWMEESRPLTSTASSPPEPSSGATSKELRDAGC